MYNTHIHRIMESIETTLYPWEQIGLACALHMYVHVHCMWGKLPVHSINLCGTWCENLTLTYGTNDTSISDHTGATEHVQQGDMLHMCGSTLGLVLWHHTVAIVGLGGEHSAALALPLTVGKGAGGNSLVNGAVLGHSRECGEKQRVENQQQAYFDPCFRPWIATPTSFLMRMGAWGRGAVP